MSGFSGIYFRYDIEDLRYAVISGGCGERYRGLIGNQYKGFEPYHLLVRGTTSVGAAIGSLTRASYGDLNERIRRTLDVDFITRCVELSTPAAVWKSADGKSDPLSFFFNDDNYYGGVLIDVTGTVNARAGQEGGARGRVHHLDVKYAFVDDTECPKKIMTPRQYAAQFAEFFTGERLGDVLAQEVERVLTEFETEAPWSLMTQAQVDAFIGRTGQDDDSMN